MSSSHQPMVPVAICLGAVLLMPLAPAQAQNAPQPAVAQTAPQPAAPRQPSADWLNRDSPENQAAVASRFLGLLDTGIRRADMLKVAAAIDPKNPTVASDLYLNYFLARLRSPLQNNIQDALPDVGEPVYSPDVMDAANKLLQNTISVGGKDINIGEPGTVDWTCPWDSADYQPDAMHLHTTAAFLPLAQAFAITGDPKYLDKWAGYLDDWSMNDPYFDTIHPLMVPDRINADGTATFMAELPLLAQVRLSSDGKVMCLPNRVVAQVLEKFLIKVLPLHMTYVRSNTHNWTPSVEFARVARIFEDFKVAGFYFREARRRNIEDNAVTQNLRDGTENQQDHWYNSNYLHVSEIFPLLEQPSFVPGWNDLSGDEEWKAEVREHLKEHTTWLIHDRTPQGNLPTAWNGGSPRDPEPGSEVASPDGYADPVNQEIFEAIRHPEDGVVPPYNSEWFPYGGFNLERDGWNKNDGYASFFCSPQPGAYGGYRSRSNNNTFCVTAYGQDLLCDDGEGHYMYPSSPLTVDGKNQFFHAGVYKVGNPAAHKVFQVDAWWDPANWRWLASDNFNLMEGVYAGPYADESDAPKVMGPYGVDQSQSQTIPLSDTIHDVTHQRLCMYVRGEKFWIITDRLNSPSTHTYAQSWFIPTRPGGLGFDPAKITVDQANKTISTSDPGYGEGKQAVQKVNFSMIQFSPATLTYTSKVVPREARMGRLFNYGWDNVHVSWQGAGPQEVVTALYATPPGAGPEAALKSIKGITGGKAANGFSAVTPDGTTISYLASTAPDDTLQLGDVTARAGALLVAGDRGMALDCSQFQVAGRTVTVPETDFEFDLTGAAPKFTPIYRPISPVDIGPEQDVFVDSQQVTLSSKTPGVDLRYTLDGTDPTPQSTLYTGPFTITGKTTVKARAYRPGVTVNPPQMSGTDATAVSLAVFTKESLTPAATPPHPMTGLDTGYLESSWQQLFLGTDDVAPKANGTTAQLFDTSLIPADNAPIRDAATPRTRPYELTYSGFLNVPADGVYTLYAPHEYVWHATDAGYDLRVWLGNKYGVGPFTGRVVGTNEWYPSTRIHAFGTWSIALQKGLQPFRVEFVDYRTNAAKLLNRPGIKDYIWSGVTPDLEISGPGIDKEPIPADWLMRPYRKG